MNSCNHCLVDKNNRFHFVRQPKRYWIGLSCRKQTIVINMLSRAILVRQLTMRDATRSGCRMLASRTHLFAKGKGVHGALGLGEELRSKTSFSKVITVAEQSDIVSVRAGWGHSVWLENDGIVRLMGKPYDFTNLMRFHWIGRVSQELARYYALATQSLGISEGTYVYPIELPTDFPVTACDASAGLTTLLLSDGSIRCFGQNRWMQCGVESKKSMQIYQPVLVPMVPPCTAISSGLQHCIALSQDGVIFAWGKNSKGQLGIGSGADVAMPPSKVVKIENDGHIISCSSMVFTSISAGFSHSAAICQEGFLYVWGGGMSNKLKVDAPSTIMILFAC